MIEIIRRACSIIPASEVTFLSLRMYLYSKVLSQTDKPLPVIIFPLAINSIEHTENVYNVHCEVLYLQKQGIEPVANGAMVEVVASKMMSCRLDS